MSNERMPWTCRWSEFRPDDAPAIWMEDWLAKWACLAEKRRDTVSELDRCVACAKWEPRADWTGRGE